MPDFPAETPPEGLNVTVTLQNGSTFVGRYEDGQWWVGLPDVETDAPISNSFVVSWALIE